MFDELLFYGFYSFQWRMQGVAMVSAEAPLKIARALLLTSRRVIDKIAMSYVYIKYIYIYTYIVCYRRTLYWRKTSYFSL